jgi:formylglycine-generating enzyme required for sulfatase activity
MYERRGEIMRYLIAILLVSLYACTDSNSTYGFESDVVKTVEDSLSGMLRVSGNVTAHLGTNDITAKATERPQMDVLLTYDFSIGKSEVTCGEFNAVMKSVTGLVLDCKNDSLPATDVTYYDAVLFANARSNAEKRDTA